MKKIKIIVGVSLFVFFVVVTATVGAGLVIMETRKPGSAAKIGSSLLSGGSGGEQANGGGSGTTGEVATLTIRDVAMHHTPNDCWIVINNKVYDVSSYMAAHPGGAVAITPYCGAEASGAFKTKDKQPGKDHSATAYELLAEYYLGDLGSPKPVLADKQGGGGSKLSFPTIAPTKAAGSTVPVGQTQQQTTGGLTLSAAEIGTHNTLSNCWLIVSGKVYDVTRYINDHPGGANAIAPYCGKEATAAFQTKGGGSGNHSQSAYSLLNNYYIGSVGQNVVVPTQNPGGSTSQTGTGTTTGNTTPSSTPIPQTPAGGNANPGNLTLTTGEVATHNTLQNCWLIISGKVYNVTSYVFNHPGGANAIAPYCGQDGTSAFQTKGGRGSNHSNGAYSQLNGYLIGSLGASVPVNPTTPPQAPGTNPTSPPTSGGTSGNLPSAITAKYPGATKLSGKYEDNGEWEGKISTNGQCREMKVNSSGVISKDSGC